MKERLDRYEQYNNDKKAVTDLDCGRGMYHKVRNEAKEQRLGLTECRLSTPLV